MKISQIMWETDQDTLAISHHITSKNIKNPKQDPAFLNQVRKLGVGRLHASCKRGGEKRVDSRSPTLRSSTLNLRPKLHSDLNPKP